MIDRLTTLFATASVADHAAAATVSLCIIAAYFLALTIGAALADTFKGNRP
jgi:hypothetical protein